MSRIFSKNLIKSKSSFLIGNIKQNLIKDKENLDKNILKKGEEILLNEFNENFENILIKRKEIFVSNIMKEVELILKELYPKEENKMKDIIITLKEEINDKYNKNFYLLNNEYKKYQKNPKLYNYLSHFRKHCINTDNIGYHICKKEKSKLIEIKENNEISYIICIECKKCYISNEILLYCKYCKVEYYSCRLKNNENENLLPSTWEKYHCVGIVNNTMKCIKCQSIFYLNLKENYLECLNEKCKFKAKPESIIWNCAICKTEFKSKAKIYNPLEMKIIKRAINKSLLLKEYAFPYELPCCKLESRDLIFYHNINCNGELYKGKFSNNEIIVCKKCHAMNFNDLFIWTCPLCNKRFKLYKSAFNSIFKKYIIIDNNNNNNNNNNSTNNLRYTIQNININDNYIDYRNTHSGITTPQNKKINFNNLLSHSLEDNKIIQLKSNKCESKKSGRRFLIDILEQRQNSNKNIYNHSLTDNKSNNNNFNSPKCNTQSTTLTEKKSKEINYIEQDNYSNDNSNYSYSNKSNNKIRKINLNDIFERKISNKESKENTLDNKNKENNKRKISNEMDNKKEIENNDMKKSYENKIILLDEKSEIENEEEVEIISSSESSNNIKISLKKEMTKKLDDDLDELEKEERDTIGELDDDSFGLGISRKISKICKYINDKKDNIIQSKFINQNEKKDSEISLSKYNDEIRRRSSLVSLEELSSNSEYTNYFDNILTNSERLKLIANECFLPEFDTDDYEYIEPIGEGSFGKIYSVKNINNGKKYALKKIICNDLMAINKIQTQLELIYSKPHDHIMKVTGVEYKCLDITTYSLYILMELGKSDWNDEIKRRIKDKNYYKENEIIDILKQIIDPLIFLEKEGIAHRDIKPQNILIFDNNIFKVTDFGEAKILNDTVQISTLRGSELYMSPMLYNGLKYNQKNIIHNVYKSDVYSLGLCLLYALSLNSEILTNLREIISMKVISSMISKSIKKYYSKKLINLIVKMLEFDEKQRFSFEDIQNYIKQNYN